MEPPAVGLAAFGSELQARAGQLYCKNVLIKRRLQTGRISADRPGTLLWRRSTAIEELLYRLETPRAIFFTFFFFEPRGSVRLALGAAFLRAARFSFFRSCVSSILVVSATGNLFRSNLLRVSRKAGECDS